MDETPAFFDMVPNKFFAKRGSKTVRVRTSGCEKKHVTVALTTAANGNILPPMIIFPGKTERTLQCLKIPTHLCVATREKAWMEEEKMQVWYEKCG